MTYFRINRALLLFIATLLSSVALAGAPDFNSLRQQYSQAPALWPAPELDPGVVHRELGLLPNPVFPKDNPLTAAGLVLGEKLFHDPRLSRSNQIACASCHDRDLGWADGRRVSFGHDRQAGKRNAPTLENIAFQQLFFWDGRANSLEQQALMPIVDPTEMHFSLPELVEKLSKTADYPALFARAFGSEQIDEKRIAQALANYQRTLISRLSAFDYFLLARTETDTRKKQHFAAQLSDQALWGLHLFRTKARCLNCHNGPELSNGQFHNIGLTYYKREYEDLGRYQVTANPADVGKFKTPGLRGVMNTKPWMHNGLFSSMEGIINIYNAGGVPQTVDAADPLSPRTDALLKPLGLNRAEIAALLAFLEAISAAPARQPAVQVLQQHNINFNELQHR